VRRTVKTSSDFLKEMFRWERSAIQSHIRTVLEVPQIYDSVSWFERLGRLLRLVPTTRHILAWVFAFLSGYRACAFALLLIARYMFEAYPSYRNFFTEHPYMRRYWWAAVGQDFFSVVQDYVCWMTQRTLHDTRREACEVTVEDQHKRD
jgi:hypothetical protein